jgi:hypothetical protein
MKDIFLKAIELLNEIPELKWKDKDKGQLEFYETRPAVDFPCALVKIELPRAEDRNSKIQDCDCLISIRLGFDFTGETSSNTPAEVLESSLSYYDIIEKVYVKFQGFGNKQLEPFSRKSFREETRNDGLLVAAMPFGTGFVDYSANA